MKTTDLIGPALDWAVAKAEGHVLDCDEGINISGLSMKQWNYMPSENWSQGGPIIDREGIAWRKHSSGKWYAMTSRDLGDTEGTRWQLYTFKDVPRTASTSRMCRFDGPTPLIAAMRVFVASKLGDEVDIPEELK